MVDCQADLLPSLFSKDVKVHNWDLRRTKFNYVTTHGLYPFFHAKMVKVILFPIFSFMDILLFLFYG